MTIADAESRRLLVLDDDVDVNTTICAIAEHLGFATRQSLTYDDFVSRLDSWNPTHIVVDLAMPDVDGVETLQRLAKRGCSAVVIVVSGLGTRVLEAAARAAVENGLLMGGILSKPFTPTRLRTLLTAAPPVAAGRSPGGRTRPAPPVFEVTAETISAALDTRQFRVHYQPKISCATGGLVGFEALVRWEHPELGLIFPDRFIPLAERFGLIGRMTEQVFEQAFDWISRSFRATDIKVALNVSAKLLDDPVFPEWIVRQCEVFSLDPKQVVLEITETHTMHDLVAMIEILTRFRIRGFSLSIDDFGVGYSSLVQLARLPFSELKIDKMFVISAPGSQESRKIVNAVVGLAKALDLDVTAEGVEDEWTLEFLRDVGCDFAQGYLIARPMDGAAAIDWARTSRSLHRAQS